MSVGRLLILISTTIGVEVGSVWGANFTATIDYIEPDTQQIRLIVGKDQVRKTYKLSPTAQIVMEGKRVPVTELQPGMSVAVTTDAGNQFITRLSVRSSRAQPSGDDGARDNQSEAPAAKTNPSANSSKGTRSRDKSERNNPVAPGSVHLPSDEWTQWRGPHRDLKIGPQRVSRTWGREGPPLKFTATGLGEGYSSVAVVGQAIYTMGTRDDDEILLALDRDSGAVLWRTITGRKRDQDVGNGPRSTPTVDGEYVYALGASGDLVCAQRDDGRIVWRMNILQETGGRVPTWGICESVLIDGERLICTPGGRTATMLALDKRQGTVLWRSIVPGQPQAAYASAVAIDVGRVRQYVNYVHTGVVGVRASDGQPLWFRPESANDTANCSTPLFADDHVFTASGYGTGGAFFRLTSRGNQTQADVVFVTKQMKNHHGGMLLLDGYVYGFDEGVLTCLDLKQGKPAWQHRSVGKGSLCYADGLLFLRSEEGTVGLAEANPRQYIELGRFTPHQRSSKPAWSHPVVVGGRLYLRDQDQLQVYDVAQH